MTGVVISSISAEAGTLDAGLTRGNLPPHDDFSDFCDDPYDGEDPYLCLYRGQTIALLRRFLRTSMETGRLPSLMGKEFFRSKISARRAATFEDAVIFVHDIERSLQKLDRCEQEVIAKIVLQEHSRLDTARMLHSTVRTVARKYADGLDHLSQILIEGDYLERLPVTEPDVENCCQEPAEAEITATCCSGEGNIF